MQTEIKTCKVANYVPIKKLKFHPQNSELRSISDERLNDLKESLIKKGFYEPILVWKKNGYVLAGNQRLRAAKELIDEGYTFVTPDGKVNELPVVIEDVDEKMALQILHQANNHHGSWVQQKLAEAIKDAESLGIAVTDLGYTKEEYDKILAEAMAMADKANSETEDLDEEGVAGFSEKFMIVIECKDEDEQQELFSEFQDRGLNSRLMQ
jgi:ParB-like chromosome segregation protein Spo0J